MTAYRRRSHSHWGAFTAEVMARTPRKSDAVAVPRRSTEYTSVVTSPSPSDEPTSSNDVFDSG